jgi:hypothetical protein
MKAMVMEMLVRGADGTDNVAHEQARIGGWDGQPTRRH